MVEAALKSIDATTPVERASALIPTIRDYRAEIVKQGTIPPDLMAKVADADLLYLARPARYGGPDLGVDVIYRVARELARGDGSLGWIYAVVGAHDHLVGLYPKDVQDAYWASERPMCASSYIPAGGKAAKVDGGWVLNGPWPFCSGIDYCDWVVVGAWVPMEQEGKTVNDLRLFMFRTSDVEMVDDWHVMGLAGTGSRSIIASDLFVPDACVLRNADIQACNADILGRNLPGTSLHDNPVYAYSIWPLFGFSILASATGIARGAYDASLEDYRDRFSKDPGLGGKLQPVEMHLARASALIEASELLYNRDLDETMALIAAHKPLPNEVRVRNRRDQAFIAGQCVEAINILMLIAGGRGIRDGGPIQHALRDIYGVANHPGGSWDSAGTSYGSVALGGLPTEPLC